MTRTKKTTALPDAEIDDLVVAAANDNSAWDEPLHVKPPRREFHLSLPTEKAQRASLLARQEGFDNVEQWMVHVVSYRLDLASAVVLDSKSRATKSGKVRPVRAKK